VANNRAVITQALTATAKAHKELALRAFSKHTGEHLRILLKGMNFEGLYVEERKGTFKKIWGFKQVSGTFRPGSCLLTSEPKWTL
jgi:hypothetical protein